MSAREMLKQDIDIMPDDLINLIEGFWQLMKKREEELDEESFLQAIEDCETGNLYGPYYTVEEAMKAMLEE